MTGAARPAEPLAKALRALEEGRYFEAHEDFEALWRRASEPNAKLFLQAAAQLAAAAHKLSTGRRVGGAFAIVARASDKLAALSPSAAIDPPIERWRAYAAALLAAADAAREGRPFELPPFVRS